MFSGKAKNGTKNACGQNLTYYRKLAVLSQADLASILNLGGRPEFTKNTINSIELGKRHVTDYELQELAEALDITLADLLQDPPKEYSGDRRVRKGKGSKSMHKK